MQVTSMAEELIKINNIRNLESVSIYDLRLHPNMENGTVIVPTIMITYDGGKTLNISSRDKYFKEYARKVMQVYSEEKDNILEDKITDPFRLSSTIKIDDKTRKILESGSLANEDEIFRFYSKKEAYDTSLLYEIDEVKAIIPIVKYHIEHLFSFTDHTITFDNDITGYRTNYYLRGTKEGIESSFPLIYNKISETKYLISVGGLISHSLPITVEIEFKKDSLIVEVDLDRYTFHEESTYKITDGAIKAIHDVTKKGITISYKNETLLQCTPPSLSQLDENTSLTWYKLPWNSYYGAKTDINEISDYERMIEIHNMYLSHTEDAFYKKEFYSKTYKRKETISVKSDEIVLANVNKNSIGIKIADNLYVIETLFDDEGTNSLNSKTGKYFYHAGYTLNGITSLSENMLVPLSKSKNIVDNSDLINRFKILKYVKGEK